MNSYNYQCGRLLEWTTSNWVQVVLVEVIRSKVQIMMHPYDWLRRGVLGRAFGVCDIRLDTRIRYWHEGFPSSTNGSLLFTPLGHPHFLRSSYECPGINQMDRVGYATNSMWTAHVDSGGVRTNLEGGRDQHSRRCHVAPLSFHPIPSFVGELIEMVVLIMRPFQAREAVQF